MFGIQTNERKQNQTKDEQTNRHEEKQTKKQKITKRTHISKTKRIGLYKGSNTLCLSCTKHKLNIIALKCIITTFSLFSKQNKRNDVI